MVRRSLLITLLVLGMTGSLGLAVELYYGPPPQRGAKFSGSVIGEVSYNEIGGKEEASSYRDGLDYLAQTDLYFTSPLFKDYGLEARTTLRKTDMRTVESRQDLRIKDLAVKVYNQRNTFLFGKFFQDFSRYSLTNSLEGLYGEFVPSSNTKIKAVLARSQRESSTVPQYRRNVFGLALIREGLLPKLGLDILRSTISVITSQDDRATCGEDAAKDLDNTVLAWEVEAHGTKVGITAELAYSAYIPDRNQDKDRDWGWAFRLNPFLTGERGRLEYTFEFVDPEFYTAQGSAVVDKLRHQVRVIWPFSDGLQLDWTEDFSYDHLKGSSLSYRTTDWGHDITLSYTSEDEDIGGSVYLSWLDTNSDDIANSQEARDITIGTTIYKYLSQTYQVDLSYERRNYSNQGDTSLSEYSDRLTVGLRKDGELAGREYHLAPSLSFSYRRPKSSSKDDISFSLSLQAFYKTGERSRLRLGINLREGNSATVDRDYTRKRSYLEWEYSLDQSAQRRLVMRLERNTYSYQDSTEDYQETRLVVKVIMNF